MRKQLFLAGGVVILLSACGYQNPVVPNPVSPGKTVVSLQVLGSDFRLASAQAGLVNTVVSQLTNIPSSLETSITAFISGFDAAGTTLSAGNLYTGDLKQNVTDLNQALNAAISGLQASGDAGDEGKLVALQAVVLTAVTQINTDIAAYNAANPSTPLSLLPVPAAAAKLSTHL